MLRAHRKYRAPVRIIHDCDFVYGVLKQFGVGRFPVPETQTRGLLLIMLRWRLSDHANAIKHHAH
jgi:hypothetical protein